MRQEFSLARSSADAVRGPIEQDHYLHRWPDPRSLPFAYRLIVDGQLLAPDGRPWGVLVFKKLQHHKQTGLFGNEGEPTAWQVLDLARVWVHPVLQQTWIGPNRSGRVVTQSANAFSRMISLALKRVQRDWIDHHPPVFPELPYHALLILSYCDRQHHQGTGYLASGFEFWGVTADGSKDIYIRRLKQPRWQYEPLQERMLEVAS